jgi:hypothetical protein
MKNWLRPIRIGLVSIFIFFLLVAADMSIRQSFFYKVPLPNGYSLSEYFSRRSYLYDNHGALLLGSHPVTQFCINGSYAYGWIDEKDQTNRAKQPSFFAVNTSTADLKTFPSESGLDTYLKEQGIPPLSMRDSLTFWDIKTGYKQKTW